jgi:hypothetical protein
VLVHYFFDTIDTLLIARDTPQHSLAMNAIFLVSYWVSPLSAAKAGVPGRGILRRQLLALFLAVHQVANLIEKETSTAGALTRLKRV